MLSPKTSPLGKQLSQYVCARITRMDEVLPWYRAMPAENRSWVNLVAQAGVTIATLAIAVKRKSFFWLLATLTGVVAIGFGVYIYLDLPVPTM